MKHFLCVIVFLAGVLPACAYQTGQANRTNFNQSAPQPSAQEQYRSFSNYNNRNWGQGVQTQGVQTEIAGKSAKEFKPRVGKKVAAAPAVKPAKPAVPAAPQASTAPAAMPANMDPAAMMQGMMNAMGNMMNNAQQPGQAGQNVTMPDFSALMGVASTAPAAAPATPASTPAKK